jgi:hypothetical protein
MRHTDYQKLIDRARKAGLKTAEIYDALASRRPEASDAAPGHADINGFVAGIDGQGQRIYRPSDGNGNR